MQGVPQEEIMSDPSRPRRRILIIYNPAAGPFRMRRLGAVITALKGLAEITMVETRFPGHAVEIAREIDPRNFDVIAAAGGDGTVNEIINGLGTKDVAVGVIPLGTANVLAIEIGMTGNATTIAQTLGFGPIRPIRVGRVNGQRFIMMAGAGFDAEVVNGVSPRLKRAFGPMAYVLQVVRRGFDRSPPGLDVEVGGKSYRTASVVVCNGRHYGGPFVAAPEATLADDRLHIVLLKTAGPLAVAKYGVSLLLGMLPRLRDVEIVAAQRLTISGREGRPIQADGDIVASLPAVIEIDPDPVRLIHPV
jgi:diacylglycerol kinase (ATP)